MVSLVSLLMLRIFSLFSLFFFFNDTATTEIYTLSLHDALPILAGRAVTVVVGIHAAAGGSGRYCRHRIAAQEDRKSTRLNSSHLVISYAVFCLKKKNNLILIHMTNALRLVYVTAVAPSASVPHY